MSVLVPSPALRPTQAPLEALPPLALYVHIPWCVRKCPYCDFNSHEARGELPEQRYVAALTADLEQALPLVWGRRVHSVFFGGGTPSLLSAHALDEILSTIRARLPLSPDAEITLEANPGTFEAQKFADFRALGINRLVGRHPELRPAASAGARAHPRRARSAPCSGDRACELRQLQPRPDVRAARADPRASRRRYPQRHCPRPPHICRLIT